MCDFQNGPTSSHPAGQSSGKLGFCHNGVCGETPDWDCVNVFPPSLQAIKQTSTGEHLEPPDLLDLCSSSRNKVGGSKRVSRKAVAFGGQIVASHEYI